MNDNNFSYDVDVGMNLVLLSNVDNYNTNFFSFLTVINFITKIIQMLVFLRIQKSILHITELLKFDIEK